MAVIRKPSHKPHARGTSRLQPHTGSCLPRENSRCTRAPGAHQGDVCSREAGPGHMLEKQDRRGEQAEQGKISKT